MASLGIGIGALVAYQWTFPLALIGWAAGLVVAAALVSVGARGSYVWVEIVDVHIRAKHLYTGRITTRPLPRIAEVRTMHYPFNLGGEQAIVVAVLVKLVGRIRGIEIIFTDNTTPIRVYKVDPAMRNAAAFIETLLTEMAALGELQTDSQPGDNGPMVKRVLWKTPPGPAATVPSR